MNRRTSVSLVASDTRPRQDTGAFPIVLRGRSEAASRQLREVMEAASSGEPSVIVAEQGLEPDTVARLIHGPQNDRRFLTIDCAAVAPELHERLFGGAEHARPKDLEVVRQGAAVAAAEPTTILLDAIEELPAAVQRRLARVLKDREVYVADARRPVDVRVRFIGTAHPGVEAAVAEGRVRADLFRRLASRLIRLAALRERPEDMPEVVTAITRELAAVGERPRSFTPAALTALASLPWPRNIAEVREVLTRLQREGPGTAARQEDVLRQVGFAGRRPPSAPFESLRDARHRFERDYIAAVLARHQWRIADAAGTLGIERANLYRKIRQLGLSKPPGRPAGEA